MKKQFVPYEMKKQFVPYEIALALKNKGFDELCFGFYFTHLKDGEVELWIEPNERTNAYFIKAKANDCCVAPTYQQVIDWFRRKHRYHINVTFREFEGNKLEGINSVYFDIEIYKMHGGDVYKEVKIMEWSDHYYVCLIKGINEALKLI